MKFVKKVNLRITTLKILVVFQSKCLKCLRHFKAPNQQQENVFKAFRGLELLSPCQK